MQRVRGEGKVLKVAANPDTLRIHVHRSLCGASCVVVEVHFVMNPVPDGYCSGPTFRRRAKQVVRDAAEAVDLAVSARQQELQHVVGKVLHMRLLCICTDRIGMGICVDDVVPRQPQVPHGRHEASAPIAESVEVLRRRHDDVVPRIGADELLDTKLIARTNTGRERRMQMENGHHGRGKGQMELDVELRKDVHGVLRREVGAAWGGLSVTRGRRTRACPAPLRALG